MFIYNLPSFARVSQPLSTVITTSGLGRTQRCSDVFISISTEICPGSNEECKPFSSPIVLRFVWCIGRRSTETISSRGSTPTVVGQFRVRSDQRRSHRAQSIPGSAVATRRQFSRSLVGRLWSVWEFTSGGESMLVCYGAVDLYLNNCWFSHLGKSKRSMKP